MQWLQAKLPKLTLWKIAVAGQIVNSHYLGKSKIFLVWPSFLKVRKLAPFSSSLQQEKCIICEGKLAIIFLLSQIMDGYCKMRPLAWSISVIGLS